MATSGYGAIGAGEKADAADAYWEQNAAEYSVQHAATLGRDRLVWCPEGLDEDQVHLLGDLRGLRCLEVGCGAAQGARWSARMGAQTVGIDLSQGMLHQAQTLGTGGFTLVQADAAALPFADRTFDVAFTAFGALPFVSALVAVHREVARVLRPGGRWVFSTTHPFAWVFPESSRPEDLRVQRSYFGLEPYFERADDGHLTYAEYHATFQDHVNSLVEAGFTIRRMLEPQWGSSGAAEGEWAAWGRERGELVPSTLIIAAQLVACRC